MSPNNGLEIRPSSLKPLSQVYDRFIFMTLSRDSARARKISGNGDSEAGICNFVWISKEGRTKAIGSPLSQCKDK